MPSVPVSVIMPVYNNAETLPRALDSIAAQTARPAEILLCDDGSTDPAVAAYLQSLGTSYQGIPLTVFTQSNAGAGAARNRCLAHAGGAFIAFLDADDWWLPEKLARSLAELTRTGSTFVAHNFYAVEPNGTQHLRNCAAIARRTDWLNRGDPRTHYFYRGFIGILTVVIRREALLAAHGFDSHHRYALDWDCWHAVLAATGGTFTVFDDVLACYTLNPAGLTSKGIARLNERLSYLPRYVRGVARAGGVPWPLLLLRGWLTVVYEIGTLILRRRQWGNLLRLVAGVPMQLAFVFARTLTRTYHRPDFLATLTSSDQSNNRT